MRRPSYRRFCLANWVATSVLRILDGKYFAISSFKDGKQNAYFKYSRIYTVTPTQSSRGMPRKQALPIYAFFRKIYRQICG
jgi:hypothetical protein